MATELLNKQILWYKKKLQAFSGRMIITEDRFSFFQAPKWAMMFGAIGALIAGSSKGKALIDDDIKNLKFAKGRQQGKKHTCLKLPMLKARNSIFFLTTNCWSKFPLL